MLTLEEVKTVQEAKEFYRGVIRNCDPGLVRWIESEPDERADDTDKVRAAKAAYRKLRSLSPAHPHRRTAMHS
jgi:hypothetical protein